MPLARHHGDLCDKEEILFSNDVFGRRYATESLYDDTVNQKDLFDEAEKYYANILNIYNPMVNRKVKEMVGMNLPLEVGVTIHGTYQADHRRDRRKVSPVVNQLRDIRSPSSMIRCGKTQHRGQAIADGIRDFDPTVRGVDERCQGRQERHSRRGVPLQGHYGGQPDGQYGHYLPIAGLLEMIHGMKCKNKKAAAFGSIGWGGGGEKRIQQRFGGSGLRDCRRTGQAALGSRHGG